MSIEVKNISKSFGQVTALSDMTLSIEEKKIYGLLGRNGAGKTTLLNLITNRLFPTAGTITVDDLNVNNSDKALGRIYYMSEATLYPESMRVKEALKWTKAFYGDAFDEAYAQKLCETFALDVKRKVKQLSTGYSSIFKIVIALSLDVPYILLDEPVLGLDANHREVFYRLLLEAYSEKPRTFIVSTHLIEEVSGIIEQAIIVKEGKLIRNESVETLLKSGYAVTGAKADVEAFISGKALIGSDTLGGMMTAYLEGDPNAAELPATLSVSAMDLQKLFIRLTNQ